MVNSNKKFIISKGFPDEVAKLILEHHPEFMSGGVQCVYASKDKIIWKYENGVYLEWQPMKVEWEIESWVSSYCKIFKKEEATDLKKDKENEAEDSYFDSDGPFPMTPSFLSSIFRHLIIRLNRGVDFSPADKPSWVNCCDKMPDQNYLTVFRNGIIDVKKFLEEGDPFSSFLEHNCQFLNCRMIPIEINPVHCGSLDEKYQPCMKPMKIIGFLKDIFQEDEDGDSVQLIREFAGNTLVDDKSFEKGIWLRGQPRSGKGTICALLENLHGRIIPGTETPPFGEPSYISMTGMGMVDRFGMEDLLGKNLVVITEPRLEEMRPQDRSIMMQILLQIISRDSVTIQKKSEKSSKNIVLPCKVIVQTNDPPNFKDKTGAILSRFIHVTTRKNYLGRENINLLKELSEELPKFIWWALTGYKNLVKRGRYIQPQAAINDLQVSRQYVSPVKEFVEEECTLDPSLSVIKKDLYEAYEAWSKESGAICLGNQEFCSHLITVCERGLGQTTNKPKRWKGISLKPSLDDPRALPKAYKED